MHDHCINPDCGAVLRIDTVHVDGFNGWCCIKCGWQLTYAQIDIIVPKPPREPSWQERVWRYIKR